jgi:hypothetical protein
MKHRTTTEGEHMNRQSKVLHDFILDSRSKVLDIFREIERLHRINSEAHPIKNIDDFYQKHLDLRREYDALLKITESQQSRIKDLELRLWKAEIDSDLSPPSPTDPVYHYEC